MRQRAWVEFSTQLSEGPPAGYDYSAWESIPGTDSKYSPFGVMYDPNETSVPWYPGWSEDPTNGYDYFKKTIVGFHFSEPSDSDAYAPGFEGYNWQPRKYYTYYIERSEVPSELDFGGIEDLERAGFDFGDGWASISWSDLRATGFASVNIGKAVQHVAEEVADRVGATSLVRSALRVKEVHDALSNFTDEAFEVLDYGIGNFENISAAEFDERADRLFRNTQERFLELAEDQLGTSGGATRILKSINIVADVSRGAADLEVVYSRTLDLDGAGIVVLGAEVSSVIGSSHRDVVINSGDSSGSRSDRGQGEFFGISRKFAYDYASLYGGSDVFIGSKSNEFVRGGEGDDALRGYGGSDLFVGGYGRDLLSGGDGDDVLVGGIGADKLYGGDGLDTIDFSQSDRAVSVDLDSGAAFGGDASGDVISSIERVAGSAFQDRLRGTSDADVIGGNDGNDRIYGRDGDDALSGGDGGDYIDAGDGDDLVHGGDGHNVLIGGKGLSDTLSYKGVRSSVWANLENGSSLLSTDRTSGFENVVGGDGGDKLRGGITDNRLSGGGGSDFIAGRGGEDIIFGGSGNDTLHGGEGNDTIIAGSGHDTVFGGLGDDDLKGNAGGDVFVFNRNDATLDLWATDLIIDFVSGLDKILLRGIADSPEDALSRSTVTTGWIPAVVGDEPTLYTVFNFMDINGLEIWVNGATGIKASDILIEP